MSTIDDNITEDEALQNVFFFLIERMMKSVKEYTLAQFREHQFPVTKDQWVILKRISEIDGSTQKEIAESTFKDPAALTRILDLLEKKGLVRRHNSELDRRTFSISMTVEGRRLVNKMIPVVQEIRAKALKSVSQKELDLSLIHI